MNVILTGKKGSGKSFAAAKILKALSVPASGFLTVFENRWDDDRQTLYVQNLDGSLRQCAAVWRGGRRESYLHTFDDFASGLISRESQLVFIDELGFLEKDSEKLKAAVNAAFDSEQNVLAVVRLDAQGWMQELKSRSDTKILTVTEDNRELIPHMVSELLKK